MNLPLSYFENLVSGAVRVKQADDVQPIALICFEAHQRGEQVAAWHASAQFYGYLHRCNCVPCTKKREAVAVSKVQVAARHLLSGDRVGSGETIKWVGVGVRTPRGKVEVHLEKDGKSRLAIWGASTLINVQREAV